MLVLTRKVGEGIAIGDDVKIVVMQIKGKQVRLGIKASATTTVHREEVYQKIIDENRAASGSKASQVSEARDIMDEQGFSLRRTLVKNTVRIKKDDDPSES